MSIRMSFLGLGFLALLSFFNSSDVKAGADEFQMKFQQVRRDAKSSKDANSLIKSITPLFKIAIEHNKRLIKLDEQGKVITKMQIKETIKTSQYLWNREIDGKIFDLEDKMEQINNNIIEAKRDIETIDRVKKFFGNLSPKKIPFQFISAILSSDPEKVPLTLQDLIQLSRISPEYMSQMLEVVVGLKNTQTPYDLQDILQMNGRESIEILQTLVKNNHSDLSRQIKLMIHYNYPAKTPLYQQELIKLYLHKGAPEFDLEVIYDMSNDIPYKAKILLQNAKLNPSLEEIVKINTPTKLNALEFMVNKKAIDLESLAKIRTIFDFEYFKVLHEVLKVDGSPESLSKFFHTFSEGVPSIKSIYQVAMIEYFYKKGKDQDLFYDYLYGINNESQLKAADFLDNQKIPYDLLDLAHIKNYDQYLFLRHLYEQKEIIDFSLIGKLTTPTHIQIYKRLKIFLPHTLLTTEILELFNPEQASLQLAFLEKMMSEDPVSINSHLQHVPLIKSPKSYDFLLQLKKNGILLTSDLKDLLLQAGNEHQMNLLILLTDHPQLYSQVSPYFGSIKNPMQIEAIKQLLFKKASTSYNQENPFPFHQIINIANQSDYKRFLESFDNPFGTISLEDHVKQIEELNKLELQKLNGPVAMAAPVGCEEIFPQTRPLYQHIRCSNPKCSNEYLSMQTSDDYARNEECRHCDQKTCTHCGLQGHKDLPCGIREHSGMSDSSYFYTGIPNKGNTCFANSSIKLLAKLYQTFPQFKDLLSSDKNPLVQEKNESDRAFDLRKKFQFVLNKVLRGVVNDQSWQTSKNMDTFFQLFSLLVKERKEVFGQDDDILLRDQFDPEEFLVKVFDYLEFQKTPLAPQTADAFALRSGKMKIIPTTKSILPIPLVDDQGQKNFHLQQAMDKEFENFENLPDYLDTDSKLKGAQKAQVFLQAPSFLIVQEKRYEFDMQKMRPIKHNHQVELAPQLKIRVYDKDLNLAGIATMELMTTVNHFGNSTRSGHYYAFIKDGAQQHMKGKEWVLHNDGQIHRYQSERLADEFATRTYLSVYHLVNFEKTSDVKKLAAPGWLNEEIEKDQIRIE